MDVYGLNWLSYVTDDPNNASVNTTVYVPSGGAENYAFNSATQTFSPDPQSHVTLVRTSSSTYEKRFPDSSKQVFNVSNGATSYPRRIFMTQWIDSAGNAVTLTYDSSFRITAITDALGQTTTLSYELSGDPLKITKTTDPFSRYATFEYQNGQLWKITDPVGIVSQFHYTPGTDFIDSLTTPYGTTNFVTGQSGTNRWIEMTDPLGGKERVEYRDNAHGISATDPSNTVPSGFTNSNLNVANTFYWDKKATQLYPPVNGVYDYTKARLTHWLYNADGSTSGIVSSEKAPLENRVWYKYDAQLNATHTGPSGNPIQVARVLDDASTRLWQYEYNSFGKMTKSTDPALRVMSYDYDPSNNIDLLTVRQTTGSNNDLLRTLTYNSQHEPLTATDAAGQTTAYTYKPDGQIDTVTNAKGETTTYGYGTGTAGHPLGYLDLITSPPVGGFSAKKRFVYDSAFFGPNAPNRIACIIDEPDHYVVEYRYDDLDRVKLISYPDGSQQTFDYVDPVRGMTLDLTHSYDRRGRLTTRHYDSNRHMDSITDPLQRTTSYGWCSCGSLTSITDPNNHITTFNRDLQSRVTSKGFADGTSISYVYENSTSRLKSMTDAKSQRTNYQYFADDNLQQVSYTNTSGSALNPPTPSVNFTYDPNYNRVATMSDGIGTTNYGYYPVTNPPPFGTNQLKTVDGPFDNDTITYSYDELGRTVGQSINGVASNVSYDALRRVSMSDNTLGHFERAYDGVTPRLQTLAYPNGQTANYMYFDNLHDRRLQTLQNLAAGSVNLSKFDYIYDPEGQIITWAKQIGASPGLTGTYTHDLADQLKTATTATITPPGASSYDYDAAGNRKTDQQGTVMHTFNEVNEITDPGFLYDANGNLTSDGLTAYTWDAANRLIAIQKTVTVPPQTTFTISAPPPLPTPTPTPVQTVPPSPPSLAPPPTPTPIPTPMIITTRSEFSYDGLGRRVRIIEREATGSLIDPNTQLPVVSNRRYVWSGNTLAEERDGTNSATVTKRFFAEGEQRIGGSDAGNYYYTRDHLGSIREVIDANGVLHAQYEYDPYGVRTKISGDATFESDFGFTGYWHHGPSDLDFSLYRPYKSALGRWISRDPLENAELLQGPNLYEYVGNAPISRIDPDGLAFVDCAAWLAELARAEANLAKRLSESGGNPDPGHEKAIEQARNRVANAREKVAKFCKPDPETCKKVAVTAGVVGGAALVGGAILLAPETGGLSLILLVP